MRGLIEFSNRPKVRDVVSGLTKYPSVQGVVAEYQGLWLRLMHSDPVLWDGLWREWRKFRPFPYPPPPSSDDSHEPGLGQPLDLLRSRWQEWFDGADPYQLRVCLRPGDSEDTSRVPQVGADFPIVFEERPLARLTALRTTAGVAKGTLGGAVKSIRNDWLGVTCGHVVKGASTVTMEDEARSLLERLAALIGNKATNAIITGECVKKNELVSLAPGGLCNPYGSTDPSNTVDVAVIKAPLETAQLEKWTGAPAPRASARSGQAAKMLSASGPRRAEIGGLNIYYVLGEGADSYCFGGLFEVLAPKHAPKIVSESDSGSWIMRHGAQGDEWFGVVLGSDDLRGFAMFAEPVYEWMKAAALV